MSGRTELSPWRYSSLYLGKWFAFALVIGLVAVFLVFLFETALGALSGGLAALGAPWIYRLPALGGLAVGLLALREPSVKGDGTQAYIPAEYLPLTLVAVLVTGLAGLGLVGLYEQGTRLFARLGRWTPLAPAVGRGGVGLIALALGPRAMGTGQELIGMALGGTLLLGPSLLLLLGRSLAAPLTVASGGSAGLLFPAMLLGCCVGNVAALALGGGDPGLHQAVVCASTAASMAAILNVLISAAVLLTEIFGLPMGAPILLGSILGFLVGRPKVIYQYR